MRLFCVVLLGSVLSSAAAHASSFVTLPAADPASSTSIVHLGKASSFVSAPAIKPAGETPFGVALAYPDAPPPDLARPAVRPVIVSPSIIALGEPAANVEDFRVAAISEKPKSRPAALPMVMRGGLVGEAFVRSGPQGAEPPASEPAPQQASTSSGPPQPQPKPSPQRQPEQPPAPPPPAPSGPPGRFSVPK